MIRPHQTSALISETTIASKHELNTIHNINPAIRRCSSARTKRTITLPSHRLSSFHAWSGRVRVLARHFGSLGLSRLLMERDGRKELYNSEVRLGKAPYGDRLEVLGGNPLLGFEGHVLGAWYRKRPTNHALKIGGQPRRTSSTISS